ncbi:YceD family protein [Roseiarcaceae bacterium H3SJ34-1]|uniref:YceD family protein n=1 Tax=Terripilifer ovatus TaxID=3032367 RepID=UPI003AB95586|nr:YceD family protein [Roseiarcaceae bacterium H3SJ34-1]
MKHDDLSKAKSARSAKAKPAFSRPVLITDLLRDPDRSWDIEADTDERQALSELNEIEGIASLKAKFNAVKAGKFIRITGRLDSRLTQQCVVSLEPFETEISEEIDARFFEEPTGPARRAARDARSERTAGTTGALGRKTAPAPRKLPEPVSMDEDEAEAVVDGRIDLGALASEFLTLALDPYPRKPGVAFDASVVENSVESPFSELGALKGEGRKKR